MNLIHFRSVAVLGKIFVILRMFIHFLLTFSMTELVLGDPKISLKKYSEFNCEDTELSFFFKHCLFQRSRNLIIKELY